MGASSRRRALPCGSSGDLDKSETLCYAESAGQVAVVTGDGSRAFTRCPVRPDHRHGRRAAHPVLLGETDRAGGNVVLPWANSYTGPLVALTVSSNGDASDSIVAEGSFMSLRDQRERRGPVAAVVGYDEARAKANTTGLHPYWVTGDQSAQVAVGHRSARRRRLPVHTHGPRPASWKSVMSQRCCWSTTRSRPTQYVRFCQRPDLAPRNNLTYTFEHGTGHRRGG